MAESTADYISPQQLCIGLHVHLDLSWTDHPFTFSSFKIRNLEQISTLQTLGLTRIRYSRAKSDVEPLDAPPTDEPLPPPTAQRKRAAACEREFLSSARAMKSINHNLFAQPGVAREEAVRLIQTMADSMLVETDMAIQLMKDKIGGDAS